MRAAPDVLLLAMLIAARAATAADWPQFGFDARHSGVNPSETAIHRANVATLHVLWSSALPGVADGPPVLLESVPTAGGSRSVLFTATRDGWLVALDAANGGILWSRRPASGPGFTTSSPAVDPSRLWIYSYGLDGKVHRWTPGDGSESTGGGWPQVTTLKGDVEKCSSALATAVAANGTAWLYVLHAGYPGDAGDYQGHLTAIDLGSGVQHVFNANCSDQTVHFVAGGSPDCAAPQSAIWGRPGVAYDAAGDRIYLASGNGAFDASTGGHDFGDSVFSLRPDGTGASGRPLDSYTPAEFQQLQDADTDLGSTSPVLFPVVPSSNHPRMGVQVGKDGVLRLLDVASLNGHGAPGFGPSAAPLGFYPLFPCRAFDTRNPAGPAGGPSLSAGASRIFPIAGSCGVPSDALAVAANVTVVPRGSSGSVRVGPAGASFLPPTVIFEGRTRAAFGLVSLTGSPVGEVSALNSSGTAVDVIVDVAGYLR